MKADVSLRFEFSPAEDADARANGWGKGILYVHGAPYWYGKSDAEPEPIEWTWVDLLEYAGANWGALVFEQSYPYEWLNDVAHPGDVWTVAERRWARLGEEQAEVEEASILAFERRHNLASAWKGLSLPTLTLMRNGHVCWICVDGRPPIRAPFEECRSAIIDVCEALARAFEGSKNPRVSAAVAQWRDRGSMSRNGFFHWVTGMSQESLTSIQEDSDPFEFWGVAANDLWSEGLVEEGPLLAAARMTAGTSDATTIRNVIELIRAVPKGNLGALDRLTAKACRNLNGKPAQFAFSHGYAAAEVVRDALRKDHPVRFDIEAVLLELNVRLSEVHVGTGTIDALAVWGSRGPAVILNVDRQHTSVERTRMTLAHELGHLVLDRFGGLPFCDVLGGTVDEYIEKRANAFAAELLLPRSVVEHVWLTWKGSIGDLVLDLKQNFSVSKAVACAQIYNSHVFTQLDRHQQAFVELRLHLLADIGSLNAIKVQSVGGVL